MDNRESRFQESNLFGIQKSILFEYFLLRSNYLIVNFNRNSVFETSDFIVANTDKKEMVFHCILKNISSSGWSWKPNIKRIQVKSYADKNIPPHCRKETTILGGFCLIDGKPIICVWDIFAYMSQKTVRSCYVSIDNIIKGKNEGFVKVTDSDQTVYISDETHFNVLVDTFIKDKSFVKI